MEKERKMFGMTIEEMKCQPLAVYSLKQKNPTEALIKYTQSILSDAQQIMSSDPETARQFINQAKFWSSEAINKLSDVK